MSEREGPGEICGCGMVEIWFSWRSAALWELCDKTHCCGVGANCLFIFPVFPLHDIHQTLQNIKMKVIIHSLSYRDKFMVHQPHIVNQSDKHDQHLRFCHLLLRVMLVCSLKNWHSSSPLYMKKICLCSLIIFSKRPDSSLDRSYSSAAFTFLVSIWSFIRMAEYR